MAGFSDLPVGESATDRKQQAFSREENSRNGSEYLPILALSPESGTLGHLIGK
jgi:hypothetical protein